MRLPSPATATATVAHPLPAGTGQAPAKEESSPGARRVLWAGGISLLIALIALLALTPPLVNANRYRNKIADSMSKSLGRPVHLDNVSMHLLPMPGFTLQNLVVSEDPDFGAEPTIRANTVEATLRVSSLWHRPVEFSTVRFVEPSVNLVRDAGGRWNISEVLMHASRVDSAPTTQGHAGPAPRFPYIEATGGRVNVKLGIEKLPFSLTDTDFALWLPSARQWRVRLIGHPARTNTDITDPGIVRVEGELQRAANLMAVPVNFRASWHDAPLGEATRIVAGTDLGWRGSLNIDATLKGTLGDALLDSKTTLGGLRRAEFFPAHPLDLQITCGSAFALHPATLTGLRCNVPDDGPQPLTLRAGTVHLQGIRSTAVTLTGEAIPVRWALLWASLFSARVPTNLRPGGTVDLDLSRNIEAFRTGPSPNPTGDQQSSTGQRSNNAWSGTLSLALPHPAQNAVESGFTNVMTWRAGYAPPGDDGSWPSMLLPASSFALGPGMTVGVEGFLDRRGYQFTVFGKTTPAALLTPARYLPQLGDGVAAVFAEVSKTEPQSVDFTCTRAWNAAQTCDKLAPVKVQRSRPAARRGTRVRAH